MPVSKAQKKATQKYIKSHYDRLEMRIAKGEKEYILAHAVKHDGSLNKFLKRAVDETIDRDNRKDK